MDIVQLSEGTKLHIEIDIFGSNISNYITFNILPLYSLVYSQIYTNDFL